MSGRRARAASRKLLVLAALPLLVLSSCGPADVDAEAEAPQGPRFIPQVVDTGGNVGAGVSLATDLSGAPLLAYLALEPTGAVSQTQVDVTGPALPAVKHANLVDGAWLRSAVAEEATVTADDATALVVDADGQSHVAWATDQGVFYASGGAAGFSEAERVAPGTAEGASIALAGDGSPLLAFYQSDVLMVATRRGDAWQVGEVARAAAPEGVRTTGIGEVGGEILIAYGDGERTMLARSVGERWLPEIVDSEGGISVRMALDADGLPHLAYLTSSGEARHAHGPGGVVFTIFEDAAGPDVSLDLVVDAAGVHHVVWSDGSAVGYANDAEGDFGEGGEVPASEGGVFPRIALGAEGDLQVAWYEGTPGLLHLATLTEAPEPPFFALPAPTGTPTEAAPTGAPAGPPPCEPDGSELTITAPPGAAVDGFDKDCLAAPTAEGVTIDFANEDPGVQHNVAIYRDESAAESFFVGEIFPGVDARVYEVDSISDAGVFFFRCDVHPATMTGTFVVA